MEGRKCFQSIRTFCSYFSFLKFIIISIVPKAKLEFKEKNVFQKQHILLEILWPYLFYTS